jgi:hypothetical protein
MIAILNAQVKNNHIESVDVFCFERDYQFFECNSVVMGVDASRHEEVGVSDL